MKRIIVDKHRRYTHPNFSIANSEISPPLPDKEAERIASDFPHISIYTGKNPDPKQVPVATGAPKWTIKTSPKEYLEKYPDGPNADLARQVLEAEDAAGEEE